VDIQADFDRDMDEERRQMRRERISKMKLLKEKQMRTRRYLKMAAPAALAEKTDTIVKRYLMISMWRRPEEPVGSFYWNWNPRFPT